MPFLQELLGGGQQRPTAQEMAGGIPQNADPGKRGPPPPSFTPPAVQAAQAPAAPPQPAQLMPQQEPMAAVAMGGPPMGAMGGPPAGGPPMPGMDKLGDYGGPPQNPAMIQALMARMQGGGR